MAHLNKMGRDGFDEFEKILADFKPNPVIGMEPTGIYHNNFLDFLKARKYNSGDTFLKSSNKGPGGNSFFSERIHELAFSSISGECSEYKKLLKLRIRKKWLKANPIKRCFK